MDSLKNIMSDIRIFLYGGLRTLPLTVAGTMLILGLFTANYAMLFFLIGFLILTPLVSSILNMGAGALMDYYATPLFKTKTTDICRIVIPYSVLGPGGVGFRDEHVVFSTWLAMIAFLIGYVFTNGLELYNRESPEITMNVKTTNESDLETRIHNRKTQALVAMGSALLFGLLVIAFRLYSGCENVAAVMFTFLAFVFGGYGWYRLLASVGEDRLSDLFGIANRLLPPTAVENGPIACLPMRA